MRTVLSLLMIPLIVGCHARFKKHAPTLGAVRAEVITVNGPNVTLPSAGGDDVLSVAFDVAQTIRANNIASHIAKKVDPEQVNAAFIRGFSEQLGMGPPFAYDPGAGHVLQFELVDWGLTLWNFFSPGVYDYELVVRGFRSDGKQIYRARVRCTTDASGTGWAEMSPFAGNKNPNKIKNIPAEEIQAIFDATAEDCGRQAVRKIRSHAG